MSDILKVLLACGAILAVVLFVYWRKGKSRDASEQYDYVRTEAHVKPAEGTEAASFTGLSEADKESLKKVREVILTVLKEHYSIPTLRKDQTDLPHIQRILDGRLFDASQTYELRCLGVVFGDILATELGLRWFMISDEFGIHPTLQIPEINDNLNPVTMISKRVERGDSVDVHWLFKTLQSDLQGLKEEFKRQ